MAKHHIQQHPQQPPIKTPSVVAVEPDAPVVVAGLVLTKDEAAELAEAHAVNVPTVEEAKTPAKTQEKPQAVKAYRISSPLERGFWRAKRHFDRKPVDIPAEKLTAEEVKLMVETDPRHLTVEIIKG